MKEFRPNLLDRAVSAIAPAAGMRRMAARQALHLLSYDGARQSTKRSSAPQNISPNSFDVQRDRLQLMREAEDLERNFAPAKHLNRKYALYTSPISYHAATGDSGLDKEVEAYLNDEVFPNCDVTGRFDFFKMMEFGVMGCNRGGDYGWAFLRPELEEGMSEEEALQLDLKIQAVEPDRIGGIYQNVVSNDYVSGCIIGAYGGIDAFRVFHRSMTTSVYDNPVDIPADQFVHLVDPMRIDMYRGVSVLSTAVQNLRDIYEMVDSVKGKAKLASALTVFTNSNGATVGSGAFDPYGTTVDQSGGSSALQQDIAFGQINHLAAGADIKFPTSNSPSSEEQALITLLLKFVAMSYGLPYSFALDASTLGGVSSRLESEMAKAEFERGQRVLSPHAHRIKNTFLIDAIAKGVFPIEVLGQITKGRWGYRPHPQPDIGKEASAAVNLYQSGLLDPMKHWVDNAQDPEAVADAMARWAIIKRDTAKRHGLDEQAVFGAGPAKPLSQTESATESTTIDAAKKELSRHEFAKESTESMRQRVADKEKAGKDVASEKEALIADLRSKESSGADAKEIQAGRVAIDRIKSDLEDAYGELRRARAILTKRETDEGATDKAKTPNKANAKNRDEIHAFVEALKGQGYPEQEAYAIAYDIVDSGKFSWSKLPANIQAKYNLERKEFKSNPIFNEEDHSRDDDGKFGPGGGGGGGSSSKDDTKSRADYRSSRASVGNMKQAKVTGEGENATLTMSDGRPLPAHIKPSMIPPAYRHDMQIATDKDSDVWAISRDEKGSSKRVYNPAYSERQKETKWARVNNGVAESQAIRSKIHNDINQGENKEEAAATWLMSMQATRPGSESDTKGSKALWEVPITAENVTIIPSKNSKDLPKVVLQVGDDQIPIRDEAARREILSRVESGKEFRDAGYWIKSYGATTLEGRHVIPDGDGVRLQFMGKEGVWHDHKISDQNLAKNLLDRKQQSGDGGKLFNTDYAKVSKYTNSLGSGIYSAKDLRTIRANELASDIIGSSAREFDSDADRKSFIKDVAIKVSGVLGNKPQQALESYINPAVFDALKVSNKKAA